MLIFLLLGFIGLILFIRFAPIIIFLSCVGCDLFMIFFGTMFLIDPYTAKISGSKFGNGVLNVVSALILLTIYLIIYFYFARKPKLRIIFIIWNILLSFYGAYYLYEAFAYLILPIFGVNNTTIMPIFKWEIINKVIYCIIIGIMGILITVFRINYSDSYAEDHFNN